MARPLTIGVDIGTTNVKALVLDTQSGKILAAASQPQSVSRPQFGWAEQEPHGYWNAVVSVIRSCLAQGEFAPDIAAIGLSGLVGVALPVGAHGEALRPAIIWMDGRSRLQCQEIRQKLGDVAFGRDSDNRIGPWFVEPKVLWMKRHEPSVFAAIHKLLSPASYCGMRLTGAYAISKGDAGPFFAYDDEAEGWNESLAAAIGMPIEFYPPIYNSHDVVGRVTLQAAQETGLTPGTLVVAGGTDIGAAALGVGVVQSGQAYYSMGTGANLGIIMPTSKRVQEHRILRWPHVLAGLTLFDAPMAFAGGALAWFHDHFGDLERQRAAQTGEDAFDLLTAEAARIGPCSDGLLCLPYLGTTLSPHWNASATGVYFGVGSTTQRAHFIRALIEGVAFELALNVEIAQAAGIAIDRLTLNGGPTRSKLWNQITADVLGLPLDIMDVAEAAPFGDAILAATGAGLYHDAAAAARNLTSIRGTIEPDPVAHARYRAFFELWKALYQDLRDNMSRHRALIERFGMK